jgi:hypothetical protein
MCIRTPENRNERVILATRVEVPQVESIVLNLAFILGAKSSFANLYFKDHNSVRRQNHDINSSAEPVKWVFQEYAPANRCGAIRSEGTQFRP